MEKQVANLVDISDFTSLIGVDLPSEYKYFLLNSGGGELEDAYCFRMTKPGKLDSKDSKELWDCLGYFDSFDPSGAYDLRTKYKYMSSKDREFPYIPNEMIVIGGAGGSCLLLGIKGIYKDKIYFWHSDLFHGDEKGDETYENISFVANNFNEFLDSLEVEKAV